MQSRRTNAKGWGCGIPITLVREVWKLGSSDSYRAPSCAAAYKF
jgi:hypothetical protein